AIMILTFVLALSGCGIYSVNVYPEAEKYSAGNAEIKAKIENIDIDYASGQVNVKYHDKSALIIDEKTNMTVDDSLIVHYFVDGTTLKIKFSASGAVKAPFDLRKTLTLTLPESVKLDSIKINTSSASVFTEKLNVSKAVISTASGRVDAYVAYADEIDVDTASGDATVVTECGCESVNIDTASGKVKLDALGYCGDVKVHSSSGNVELKLFGADKLRAESSSGKIYIKSINAPTDCYLDTSSGDITLEFDGDASLTAKIDTASGDFDCDFPVLMKNGKYIIGGGDADVRIDTSSGDIKIKKAD
ncbi:MAG: DUF4097 family beta strand repeat protein, partial [Clostridiales bacterium]|nr:DUF4097 family beta strand repeat protein [Clostridiales bacterium]